MESQSNTSVDDSKAANMALSVVQQGGPQRHTSPHSRGVILDVSSECVCVCVTDPRNKTVFNQQQPINDLASKKLNMKYYTSISLYIYM